MNDKSKLTTNELKTLAIIPYGAKKPIKAKEIQGAIHKASRSSGGHYR